MKHNTHKQHPVLGGSAPRNGISFSVMIGYIKKINSDDTKAFLKSSDIIN